MAIVKQNYEEFGVQVSKSRIYVGDEITIYYNGLLSKSGAEMVYLHIGYGQHWNPSEYIPMNYLKEKMQATFVAEYPGELNVCFKDTANNWDNNSSVNYTFKIFNKKVAKEVPIEATKKTTKKKTTSKK